MTTPSTMTELEAVNVLLTTIGEQPVNTLIGNQVTDVKIAEQIINEVSREVQSQGWHFNTEDRVPLAPDNNNEINIPATAARIDLEDTNVTVRGGKLYNLTDRTYTFDTTAYAVIVYYQDFLELPDPAKRYITVRASRIYSDRMINSETMHKLLSRDEQKALTDLKEFEGDTGDFNMMDSYSVSRVMNRNNSNQRILM
tara:strand:- start:365 stop:958 length:594 start_codon:yes stop_codon:yes gene_type:complete